MKIQAMLSFIEKVQKEKKFPQAKFIKAHSKKQREFLEHLHHSLIFWGGKRSGKTLGSVSKVILKDQTGQVGPRIELAGSSLEKIKSLYWQPLFTANKYFELGWEFRPGDSLIQTRHRQIVFRSLRDIANINKSTGFQMLFVLVDEAHTIKSHLLEYYINNIVRINFLNVDDAQIALLLNPPVYPLPIFREKFFDNTEYIKIHTKASDNPSIPKKTLREFMEQEAKVLGFSSVAEASKKSNEFRRNIYGEWIEDTGRIIITPERVQYYETAPKEDMSYVLGVDIGAGKAMDAIVVVGYNKYERSAWVVEEKELDTFEEDLEKLADNIKYFYEKYKPHAIELDTGGVGNRIAGTLRTRYGIPCVNPATKKDKMAFIEELKAEIYRGRLMFHKDSSLVKEFSQIIYNDDHSEVDDVNGIHSDLFDALLYSMRAVFNAWPKSKPKELDYRSERIKQLSKLRRKRAKVGY